MSSAVETPAVVSMEPSHGFKKPLKRKRVSETPPKPTRNKDTQTRPSTTATIKKPRRWHRGTVRRRKCKAASRKTDPLNQYKPIENLVMGAMAKSGARMMKTRNFVKVVRAFAEDEALAIVKDAIAIVALGGKGGKKTVTGRHIRHAAERYLHTEVPQFY